MAEQVRESYSFRADKALQAVERMAGGDGDPQIIQACAALAQALATMTLAQEVRKIADVQAPPNTVPRHVYDEAIQTIIELQALTRTTDKES